MNKEQGQRKADQKDICNRKYAHCETQSVMSIWSQENKYTQKEFAVLRNIAKFPGEQL
jgi:hypothetical protein